MPRKRYAIVGLGNRSVMYTKAILDTYKDHAELVGYCDVNQVRMDYWNRHYAETLKTAPVPTWKSENFERMLTETKAETVIVTTTDGAHHTYICRALRAGCDVICEKPLTVDAEKCQEVLDTVKSTGKKLTTTFNCRYLPHAMKVKELVMQGVIGDITSVHLEWLLDTVHGADYFRRWHREKDKSGGLMIHKASHHFDLVNWFLASQPQTVFGMGRLVYYGRENATKRGIGKAYEYARSTGHAPADDPFALHMDQDPHTKGLYLDAEKEDGYLRDRNVFGDGISIEDDMAVMVRYRSGATMSYHLTAYSPWEGFRLMLNGTKGRIEYNDLEAAHHAGKAKDVAQPVIAGCKPYEAPNTEIIVRPTWCKPMAVEVSSEDGSHGGSDARLTRDLFMGVRSDPLGSAANHIDGAWSILTGIAANLSFASGKPINTADLVRF
jgi:predicted dehydrogenase